MEIQSLDRATVKDLVTILNEHLAQIGGELGVSLRLNGGKLINDSACELRLEVTLEGTGSVRSQRLADDLKAYGAAYLPGIDLEKPLQHSQLGTIRIVGFNSRAHRTPIICEASNGKRYRFETEQIKRLAAKS